MAKSKSSRPWRRRGRDRAARENSPESFVESAVPGDRLRRPKWRAQPSTVAQRVRPVAARQEALRGRAHTKSRKSERRQIARAALQAETTVPTLPARSN